MLLDNSVHLGMKEHWLKSRCPSQGGPFVSILQRETLHYHDQFSSRLGWKWPRHSFQLESSWEEDWTLESAAEKCPGKMEGDNSIRKGNFVHKPDINMCAVMEKKKQELVACKEAGSSVNLWLGFGKPLQWTDRRWLHTKASVILATWMGFPWHTATTNWPLRVNVTVLGKLKET